ncbi:hypothetical protein N1027_18185 [Herbiconiux sp. CPCC 205763]|uniref:Uncharacterized protein n=1 Tax=Herbiconiux aconitum TaxID=2970913 RepID=A0ABT2GYQ5_9MICO|nr:hypothetical protein [Herbiconiux aconitum]MCS5720064.1 hypothetical protein [Herbiconiux aconitum]
MRGTKGFPKTGGRTDAPGAAAESRTTTDTGSDNRSGWFVLHGAAASAVAALLSYQLAVMLVADGAANARPSVNFAGLVVGLCAGVWTALVALLAWPVLNGQARRRAQRHVVDAGSPVRALRRRGFSVLHIVAIGTAVPWIVLSLLLGSWQGTTITIVVAAAAGAAGGFGAARRVWRPNRMETPRRRVPASAGIGPALEHLPAAGADRSPLAFRAPGARPPGASDDVDSLSASSVDRRRGPSY